MPSITDYIKENLQKGYSISSITAQLMKNGYSKQEINAAIDYVSGSHSYGVKTTSIDAKKTTSYVLFGIIALIIIIAIIAVLVIIPKNDTSIPTPDKPTPTVPKTNQTSNPATNPTIPDKPIQTNPTTPPTNNPQTSKPTTLDEYQSQAKTLATTNPDQAIKICGGILTSVGKNNCYYLVAIESKKSVYCDEILDNQLQDKCNMDFAINGWEDIDVCQKIHDDLRLHYCQQSFTMVQIPLSQQTNQPIDTAIEEFQLDQPLEAVPQLGPADAYEQPADATTQPEEPVSEIVLEQPATEEIVVQEPVEEEPAP